jgi:Mrp family chromosome partitioning ATPase
MKDSYASSEADRGHSRNDLMVPSQGNFTRPRQFSGSTGLKAGESIDLWGLLHEQAPGKDQHILAGSQAADDFRATDVSRAFDLLRTRLRQTIKQHGWVNVGVASPTTGCGNTFSAANLAASLARVPSSRTVLMDFNMRKPGLAKMLDMDASQIGDQRDFLAGDVAISDYILRASDTLAVGLAAGKQSDAAEIMQDPATAASLAEMRATLQPDVVIYDLPPLLSYDDTSAFLPQLDGLLLVSDGTQTMAKHIAECERALAGQVPLLGVILNRARASSIERF